MGGSTDGLELVGGGCVRAGVRVSPVSRGSARALGARSACAPCRVSSPFTGCLRSSAFHTLSVCLSHPRLVGVGARAGLSERICEMGTLELIMFLVPNPASSCSPIDLLKLAGWLSAPAGVSGRSARRAFAAHRSTAPLLWARLLGPWHACVSPAGRTFLV